MLNRAIPERALGALLGGEPAANELYSYVTRLRRARTTS